MLSVRLSCVAREISAATSTHSGRLLCCEMEELQDGFLGSGSSASVPPDGTSFRWLAESVGVDVIYSNTLTNGWVLSDLSALLRRPVISHVR